MMFTVYFWADGNAFDVDAFCSQLPLELKGSVKTRKRFTDGAVQPGEKYWKSVVVTELATLSDQTLEDFVEKHRAGLLHARSVGAERIVLEIVTDYGTREEAKGLFLNARVLALVNSFGGAIDVDVVRRAA